MNRSLAILILALGSITAAQALGFDEAWEKARLRWNAGQAWKPHLAHIRSEELDAQGRLSSWEESDVELDYASDPQKPRMKIIRAVKDGKDVTLQRQSKPGMAGMGGAPGSRAADGKMPDPVPFAASSLPLLSFLPSHREIEGGVEEDYLITSAAKGGTKIRGSLRRSSLGLPLSLSYTLDPLPSFVYTFSGYMLFGQGPEGSLVTSSLSFRVEGGLLGFKKRMSVKMEFGDWRPWP